MEPKVSPDSPRWDPYQTGLSKAQLNFVKINEKKE